MRIPTWNIFVGADLQPVHRTMATAEALAEMPRAVAPANHDGEPPPADRGRRDRGLDEPLGDPRARLAAADVVCDGAPVRRISTHLEVATSAPAAAIRRRQAAELVEGPAATELPVALIADLTAGRGT